MRFRLDLKIFLIIAIFFLTKQIQIYAIMMIFAFIHELGHLIAGISLKMKPKKLEIIPVGVSISFAINTKDINKKIGEANLLELKKIFVALAGPITNLLIIVIVANLQMEIIEKIKIIYANSCILLFNILPIYPLDGGRIVQGVIAIQNGKRAANNLSRKISLVFTIILTIIAIIIMYYEFNIAIALIMIYIWFLVGKERKISIYKEKIYQILEKNY